MKIQKWLFIIVLMAMMPLNLALADSIRISQIDSASLLFNQNITLYLSVTDNEGEPIEHLKQSNFEIFESADGRRFHETDGITSFKVGTNYENGISFLLLIDNSESMYWTLDGDRTDNIAERRITHAKKAVKAFINSISNPKDRISIAEYNSNYRSLSEPDNDKSKVDAFLDSIERPKGDAIYSEIYGSVNLAVDEFKNIAGRKAIVILSDGVNNPSFTHTHKVNPQFGEKVVSYKKPLEALQMEGISLYVINFGKRGDRKDRNLLKIARQSGGVTFDAHNTNELKQIYLKIMDQIIKEYVVSYPATMAPADRKYVRVRYIKDKQQHSATRFYFSSTVFGQPPKQANFPILVTFILAAILLWGVSKLKFEKQHAGPTIELMNSGAGDVSTKILPLDNAQTIIGSSPNSDMTIAGIPTIEDNHATIVFDENKNQYTLIGEGKLMVNNKLVTTKVLEPGDLINLDGVTMVFDEGEETEK